VRQGGYRPTDKKKPPALAQRTTKCVRTTYSKDAICERTRAAYDEPRAEPAEARVGRRARISELTRFAISDIIRLVF